MNFFQISFLGTNYPKRLYYEKPYTHHNLSPDRQNIFLFNIRIVQNEENTFYKDPPGDSVLDPVEQLMVYAMFVLKHARYDIF